MYFSKRLHDVVNEADYSRWVVHNPPLAFGAAKSPTRYIISSTEIQMNLLFPLKHTKDLQLLLKETGN